MSVNIPDIPLSTETQEHPIGENLEIFSQNVQKIIESASQNYLAPQSWVSVIEQGTTYIKSSYGTCQILFPYYWNTDYYILRYNGADYSIKKWSPEYDMMCERFQIEPFIS